ncbi:hypothetical protein [Shewanella sedimentimangrovi]|uniref:Phage shock protein B n=1 Tax=Shewanella sedimentimangrovi TaxID=2814293 RepID=A0ABX7R2D7_9GAMM|nr:hypothetical protein [Shewanella sedimentimangrovi]QSX37230.1 hypothetical protein JYB85_18640 [Shewanella sedimentimangrovi]
MDKLTAVTMIMMTAFGAQVLTNYWRRRPAATAEINSLREENQALKQRIAALEAIVTAPDYELKRELSRL